MTDLDTFEQKLSAGFKGLMGPSEPVDDAAIFAAITTTQSPKWRFQSVSSATKFVVAIAIAALFGGFLLAGVLTQPSDEVRQPGVAASAIAPPDAPSEATVAPPTEVFARISVESGAPGGGTGQVEASDPRMTGRWSRRTVYETFVGDGIAVSERLAASCDEDGCGPRQMEVNLEAQRIENAGGMWTSRPTAAGSGLVPGPSRPEGVLLILDGSDGYDGLVAVLYAQDRYAQDREYWGFIVDADQFPSNPGGADAPFPDADPSWETGE